MLTQMFLMALNLARKGTQIINTVDRFEGEDVLFHSQYSHLISDFGLLFKSRIKFYIIFKAKWNNIKIVLKI